MPTSREVKRPSVQSERAVDNTDPRTRIESEYERGTNISKLLLPSVYLCVTKKGSGDGDERFEQELYLRYSRLASISRKRYIVTLHDCNRWLLQESVVAECPHEVLMAEAEEEGFSNYRVVNCHFQLNTQASTSPTPNMPPKAYETPAELAQAAKDYGGDTQREQMSYITKTGSAGQKACLREEGLSTSNINKAFLDAAKDILKKN
ncbi:hypothetical protein PROFUN_16363 [Planoprotostelium fungivorum]|uniref:Uncharacterized protein n=1 Tax=Planoprotostelium fungivorum TaxID=1890364 RepID=A0A2P6MQL0_9EUKA|nr:hypothetical protein PROFUN_16363 [Planoprotostelium fungivorum]